MSAACSFFLLCSGPVFLLYMVFAFFFSAIGGHYECGHSHTCGFIFSFNKHPRGEIVGYVACMFEGDGNFCLALS